MLKTKKLAALAASLAVLVPVGAAQATHDSGKEGAPGQVCKPLHPNKGAQKQALADFKATEPAPSREQVKEFRATQRAAYKGCIKGAADARSHEEENGETTTQEQEQQEQQSGENNSEGAPGQFCKELQRARRAQRREFNSQRPRPDKAERKAFRQTQDAGYKGCIEAAAEARSDNDGQQTTTQA